MSTMRWVPRIVFSITRPLGCFTPLEAGHRRCPTAAFGSLPLTGFTYIEVLAALVILSVALIPILTWVPTSIQTKLKTERKTTAIFLAQEKLEELRHKIINNFGVDYTVVTPNPFDPPYQDFSYTVNDNFNTNIKTISVKVWHIEKPDDDTTFYTQVTKR